MLILGTGDLFYCALWVLLERELVFGVILYLVTESAIIIRFIFTKKYFYPCKEGATSYQ